MSVCRRLHKHEPAWAMLYAARLLHQEGSANGCTTIFPNAQRKQTWRVASRSYAVSRKRQLHHQPGLPIWATLVGPSISTSPSSAGCNMARGQMHASARPHGVPMATSSIASIDIPPCKARQMAVRANLQQRFRLWQVLQRCTRSQLFVKFTALAAARAGSQAFLAR